MVRPHPEAQELDLSERSPPRERGARREAAILAAARALNAQGGCLAVRMADLAKVAGVSIGSLYRHFESKEDVIVGLACEAVRERLAALERSLGSGVLAGAERLVACVVADARFGLAHPALLAAEELGANGSVRQRASARRVDELDRLRARIGERILEASRAAVAAGAFLVGRDVAARTETIRHAVVTLMAGVARTLDVQAPPRDGGATPPALPAHFLDVCAATFAGLDWRVPYPGDEVERIAAEVLEPVA